MRIRQLEFFVAVCERGSITRAAAQLNVAQPALGLQLKALEDELGVALLARSRRGAVPTQAGQIFLEECRHILQRMGEVRRRLRDAAQKQMPTITLGLTPSLTTILTGSLLEAVARDLPGIRLQIFEEFSHTLLDHLARGQLDLALAYSVPPDKRFCSTPLMQEALFFACSPGSAFDAVAPMQFSDLRKATFVMPSERDFVWQLVEETMASAGLTLSVPYQVESIPAMKDLIARGMACGIIPFGTIAREVDAGLLRARPIVDPPITRTLFFTRPAETAALAAETALIGILRELLEAVRATNVAFFDLTPT
ncbi:LysR family transcriptional regulator [Aureimonas flava]|uniref:LysR family transcriptional regulator n=1 Tax=Aureimonas flava TaxID=2320271 RepID=A0A3A1WF32_9HYPH|nr:LysR family transcriptional regulator [Aureimonas flava]RIX98217.1 LysR family transcriptional regulator [Aureimonas flava]